MATVSLTRGRQIDATVNNPANSIDGSESTFCDIDATIGATAFLVVDQGNDDGLAGSRKQSIISFKAEWKGIDSNDILVLLGRSSSAVDWEELSQYRAPTVFPDGFVTEVLIDVSNVVDQSVSTGWQFGVQMFNGAAAPPALPGPPLPDTTHGV